jgi:hypothetical protein
LAAVESFRIIPATEADTSKRNICHSETLGPELDVPKPSGTDAKDARTYDVLGDRYIRKEIE